MKRRLHLLFLAAFALRWMLPASAAPAPTTNAASAAVVHLLEDAGATRAYQPVEAVVDRLVDQGLRSLTGKPTSAAAWRAILTTNDTVGFRVCSAPGPVSGTRPAVAAALVRSLIASGHPPRRIVLWDKRARDLILAGYPALAEQLGVRWAATEEVGWDEAKSYDSPLVGRLLIGDLEYGRKTTAEMGRRSYVSKLLTRDVTKIVLVTPLLNHHALGVNGQLANLALGSVDNTFRFENDPDRLASVIPELCALDDLAPRLLFGVTDALICQYRGDETTLLHHAVTLNQLRFSFDPVALDVLSLEAIRKGRASNPTDGEKEFKTELYENAEIQDLGVANPARIQVQRP
jgi:hypothetical protein